MPDDILKKILMKQAIDRMVAVPEHIRDCERCRRIYGVAFDTELEALRKTHPVDPLRWIEHLAWPPHPYKVLWECIRDLRHCERWPRDV